jgi:hypothetical protein
LMVFLLLVLLLLLVAVLLSPLAEVWRMTLLVARWGGCAAVDVGVAIDVAPPPPTPTILSVSNPSGSEKCLALSSFGDVMMSLLGGGGIGIEEAVLVLVLVVLLVA